MLELYNRRQQVALIIFLCLFIASIVVSFTAAFTLVERYYPTIDDLSVIQQIVIVSGSCLACFIISAVASTVIWLLCLKPWYRRQDLEPLFEVPPPGAVPQWWRIGEQAFAWLFDKMYP